MIEGIVIKNGVLRLVLTGSDSIDKEVLKQLNGATCRLIQDNYKVGDKSISDGLMIELIRLDPKSSSTDTCNTTQPIT